MNNELAVIETLEELKTFVLSIESGGLGLEGVVGIGMATSNKDGRHFVAVFGENHKLLLGRWITQEVFENGKEIVQNGVQGAH
ncbi:hypothetical protein [Shewanella gelidii]|uniref:Uncharacterized protein n=1 Tax=Shewanella gelidii TaxID=1642821 RepID=A0A917JLK8_9GAMM|nr:hypothetical protein [Shewanella gelidii]MCL1096979.1 hypothetical protein [Shewanella gelidii]GGI71669.1 hypothetical protein GCM10009332_06270 [Shewanella gelidii]